MDVARRDVVEDDVAADVVRRLLGAEPAAGLRDDNGQLELVVELIREVLWIDDRLVRPDDRVDVLEEDDPGRDLVRPLDALRLFLVLAEVAGGVEELLRDDRCSQLNLVQGMLLSRWGAAALEVVAHRRRIELADRAVVQLPDLPIVERDEASHSITSSALRSGGKTG